MRRAPRTPAELARRFDAAAAVAHGLAAVTDDVLVARARPTLLAITVLLAEYVDAVHPPPPQP